MDLRQLRYFVAVATTRNFTRAAEQMHIAQPPLSRQIQLLEEELGVQLIQRNSRPVRLTEAGRLFYEQSLQVLHRVDQMKNTARQAGRDHRQSITIGYVPTTLYGGLPMLVRIFRRRYPDTDVHLVDLGSIQQISELKSGRIDLGLGRLRSHDTSVARMVLREEKLVLAIPPAWPLAAESGPVSLQALDGLVERRHARGTLEADVEDLATRQLIDLEHRLRVAGQAGRTQQVAAHLGGDCRAVLVDVASGRALAARTGRGRARTAGSGA